MIWLCPKCRSALNKQERSLVCAMGHAYDIAKQGYCNLMLVDKKNSRHPGDNKEMVLARKEFLQKGFYAPLVEKVFDLYQNFIGLERESQVDPCFRLLDMGCGEGYYLRDLASKMQLGAGQALGIDISKEAIRRASAVDKLGNYAVASCYDIPLPEASIDVAISVFSPLCEGELQRVLKPHGYLLRVSPGPQHLWALKQHLYAKPEVHSAPKELPEFKVLHSENLQQNICLQERQDILNLLKMTPYFWHGSGEAKSRLIALDRLGLSLDFRLELLSVAHSGAGGK